MSSRSPATGRARIGLITLSSLALLLGACTSSSGTSEEASTAAGESAPASAAAGGDATVLVAESADLGPILTDADGNTIYYFANDEAGVSNCADDCLANWPPVEASGTPSAGDGVTATLATITRDDGTTQLTVNDFPAYYFAADEAPGDTNGQGQGDVWWVFDAAGVPID